MDDKTDPPQIPITVGKKTKRLGIIPDLMRLVKTVRTIDFDGSNEKRSVTPLDENTIKSIRADLEAYRQRRDAARAEYDAKYPASAIPEIIAKFMRDTESARSNFPWAQNEMSTDEKIHMVLHLVNEKYSQAFAYISKRYKTEKVKEKLEVLQALNTMYNGEYYLPDSPNTWDVLRPCIPVWKLLLMLLRGGIFEYEYNRGGGDRRVNISRVRKMAKTFDFNCIGQLTFAIMHDKTWLTADGLHRLYLLLILYMENGLDIELLRLPVAIQIVPIHRFLDTYLTLNSHIAHSAEAYDKNPDTFFGNIRKQLLLHLEDSDFNPLNMKSKRQVLDFILILHLYESGELRNRDGELETTLGWHSIPKYKTLCISYRQKPKDYITVSNDILNRALASLSVMTDLNHYLLEQATIRKEEAKLKGTKELRTKGAPKQKAVNQIVHSSGFGGSMFVDLMIRQPDERHFPQDRVDLESDLWEKAVELNSISPNFTRDSTKDPEFQENYRSFIFKIGGNPPQRKAVKSGK